MRSLLVASCLSAGLALLACDNLELGSPVASTARAVMILDVSQPRLQRAIDLELVPSAYLETLHVTLEKRVRVVVEATYVPRPGGPDPSPAHVVIAAGGPSVLRSQGLDLTLTGAGRVVYELEADVEATCDAELCRASIDLDAARVDTGAGDVTLRFTAR